MIQRDSERVLRLALLLVLVAASLYRVGYSVTYSVPAYEAELVGVEVCGFSRLPDDAGYREYANSTHLVWVYEGTVCVSKVLYSDNYSEPPNPFLGSAYFPGSLVVTVDLAKRRVSEVVSVNLTSYGPGWKLVDQELYAEEFTYRMVSLKDFYEEPIWPKVRFLNEYGIVNLSFVVLTYEALNCSPGKCLYSYRPLGKGLAPPSYYIALSFWGTALREFLNLEVYLNAVELDGQLIVALSADGDLDEYLALVEGISRTFMLNSDLVVFVELPHQIRYGSELLAAVSTRNFVLTSSRSVDVLIHEVGHVLGLTHPVNWRVKPFTADVFYESVMLSPAEGLLRRMSLGDLLGLAYSVSVLLKQVNTTLYDSFKNNLSALLMDVERLGMVLPLVRRAYVSSEVPKPISEALREGLIAIELDDGNLRSMRLNHRLVRLLRAFSINKFEQGT